MLSSGQLIGFTLASFVLIVVPGPGVLFVVGRALSHGRRTAFASGVPIDPSGAFMSAPASISAAATCQSSLLAAQ